MGSILFFLFYAFTWLIAQLPNWALYGISDAVKFVLYYILRYRRGVVATNLKKSFPEKTPKELKSIERKFYTHLCDLFLENFVLLHASKERALKTCKFINAEVLEKYHNQGRSVIIAAGHYSNWELLTLASYSIKHKLLGVYKPLNNKRFERFLNLSRERFGAVAVPMRDAFKTLLQFERNGTPALLGLITDQTPARRDIRYFTTFLNQETAAFLGVEKIAKKVDAPVFFCQMRKVKRGRYQVFLELITDTPKDTEPYEITEAHVKALERIIREEPQYWLWSHRRWKHKKANLPNNSKIQSNA